MHRHPVTQCQGGCRSPSAAQGGPRSCGAEQEPGSAEPAHSQKPWSGCRKGIESFTPIVIPLIVPSSCWLQARALSAPCKWGSIRPPHRPGKAPNSCRGSQAPAVPHGHSFTRLDGHASPVASCGGTDTTKPGWVGNPGGSLDTREVRRGNCLPAWEQKAYLLCRGWRFSTRGLSRASAQRNRDLLVPQVRPLRGPRTKATSCCRAALPASDQEPPDRPRDSVLRSGLHVTERKGG